MADGISDDRQDRVDALDTLMIRMNNPGLTLEEKLEISLDLQVENTRATKLMLQKNFVLKEELEGSHCNLLHGQLGEQWPLGKIVASILKVIVVCSTLTGWIIMFGPKDKEKTNEEIHVHYPSPSRDKSDDGV